MEQREKERLEEDMRVKKMIKTIRKTIRGTLSGFDGSGSEDSQEDGEQSEDEANEEVRSSASSGARGSPLNLKDLSSKGESASRAGSERERESKRERETKNIDRRGAGVIREEIQFLEEVQFQTNSSLSATHLRRLRRDDTPCNFLRYDAHDPEGRKVQILKSVLDSQLTAQNI